MKIGLFLSSEEYTPHERLEQARLGADVGMHGLWISDHVHPSIDAQGQSPFRLGVGTGEALNESILVGAWPNTDVRRDMLEQALGKWPTTGLPGELSQILPTPAHFEQAVQLVDEEKVSFVIPCGPDPERHFEAMRQFREAGVDELYVAPIGPHYVEMINLYGREIVPALR